jgi:hypothetical protein
MRALASIPIPYPLRDPGGLTACARERSCWAGNYGLESAAGLGTMLEAEIPLQNMSRPTTASSAIAIAISRGETMAVQFSDRNRSKQKVITPTAQAQRPFLRSISRGVLGNSAQRER